ncbi:hypothetical protein ACM66B_006097 [Microbotryomycetes sp. NB124-2]
MPAPDSEPRSSSPRNGDRQHEQTTSDSTAKSRDSDHHRKSEAGQRLTEDGQVAATNEDEDNGLGAGLRRTLSQHPVFAAKARGLRLRIMRFTPSWYSVTMGTGIVNTLLFDLPWQRSHAAFRAIGAGFLVLDMFLFIGFTLITIARYSLYPRIFLVMLQHETHSLFLGTIPMGLVTITSGIARTGAEYGLDTLGAALVLWWITLVMSVFTAFVVPFIMFTKHNHTSEALTAAWLLPVVPPITVAAVGSTLSSMLTERDRLAYALTILNASYVMGGVGFLIACGLMVIYFQRLALHKLPPRELIVSTFLPLGPCGQAGYALIELGRVAIRLFPLLAQDQPQRPGVAELAQVGQPMLGAGVVVGLLLWGLGMWWCFIAVASVGTGFFGKTVAFNMGWWAFTFPLGSMTLLTFSLGDLFASMFFNVVGTIMTFSVFVLWTVVFVPTLIGFLRGTLFPAPCLSKLPPAYIEKLPGGESELVVQQGG